MATIQIQPNTKVALEDVLNGVAAGYPEEITKRYESLLLKKKKQTITSFEQQELIEMSDQFEILDAERLQSLLELAQLHDISLEDLLKT